MAKRTGPAGPTRRFPPRKEVDEQKPARALCKADGVYRGYPVTRSRGIARLPREPDGQVVRIGWNLGWVKRDVKNNDRIHLDSSLEALLNTTRRTAFTGAD